MSGLFGIDDRASEKRKAFKPAALADVFGQSKAVTALRAFLANPYSCAFIFDGPTGVGKTATANALAAELGVAVDMEEFGGKFEIASGEQDGATVRAFIERLHLSVLYGSGWRFLIVNEADNMTKNAEAVWLDALERLPRGVVIVFTTNHLRSLSQRFVDRCERIEFTGAAADLIPHMAELIARVWAEIGAAGAPPVIAPDAIVVDGVASFRRLVQRVERISIGTLPAPILQPAPAAAVVATRVAPAPLASSPDEPAARPVNIGAQQLMERFRNQAAAGARPAGGLF